MAKQTFYLPTRPYTVIDAINRYAAATGSPGYARLAADADYNGHHVAFVEPNDFKRYWTCYYTWAGTHTIGRGTLAECLRSARQEYDRGALGASASVSVETDEDAAACRAAGFVEADDLSWFSPLHKEVASAFDWDRHFAVGAVGLLANSKTIEEYNAKLKAALDAQKAARRPAPAPAPVATPEETKTKQLDAVHKFERAGLGKAPFKIVGFSVEKYQACHGAPIQPGGSCDYCGTGIMDTFWIRSADGRKFKVGSDCVAKTGDAGLMKLADAQVRKLNRDRRHAREAAKIEEVKALLADAAVRAKLAALPHPYAAGDTTPRGFFRNKTALDYAEWMLSNGGNAGKVKALKAIRKLLG